MTEIWVGIISAASALAGSGITQLFEWKRRKSEEKRWFADYFLGRKIEAFCNLYSSLVDTHYTLNFYGNVPPITLKEFKEKIEPKMDNYLHTTVMASLYLDDEKNKIMS